MNLLYIGVNRLSRRSNKQIRRAVKNSDNYSPMDASLPRTDFGSACACAQYGCLTIYVGSKASTARQKCIEFYRERDLKISRREVNLSLLSQC